MIILYELLVYVNNDLLKDIMLYAILNDNHVE